MKIGMLILLVMSSNWTLYMGLLIWTRGKTMHGDQRRVSLGNACYVEWKKRPLM